MRPSGTRRRGGEAAAASRASHSTARTGRLKARPAAAAAAMAAAVPILSPLATSGSSLFSPSDALAAGRNKITTMDVAAGKKGDG